MPTLCIAQDAAADELLSRDPLALLIAMLLDQQFPMERAFAAPRLLADRLGVDTLSAEDLAEANPERLAKVFQGPPALHRYPGSMAGRTQELCRLLVARYGGRADALWADAPDGGTLLKRVGELPGFGAQKSRIFVALLGKQYGVTPPGWREASADYGLEGSRRSVADVTGPESLAEVRRFKQEQKAAAKGPTARKATAKNATAKNATAKNATAKNATAKNATTKNATTKNATVKKATVKKGTAKTASPQQRGGGR